MAEKVGVMFLHYPPAVKNQQPLILMISLDTISANANSLQDDLLKRINPNSLLRNVTVIKAAINCVIAEQSLTIPNMLKPMRSLSFRLRTWNQTIAANSGQFHNCPPWE